MSGGVDVAEQPEPEPPRCTEHGAPGRQHRLAERGQWPWLPTQRKGVLAAHPLCPDCGHVRVVGAQRARDFGGLVNLLANLDRQFRQHDRRITEAQKRLILRRLQQLEADDNFALTSDQQRRMVAQVVHTFTGVREEAVLSYLEVC